MVDAKCRNGDCGHEWTLRKHPSEYKRGVTCPECGTTRVELVDQAVNQPQQAQGPPAQAPAPAQERGGVPATGGQPGEMAQMGVQGGELAYRILEGDKYDMLEAVGGAALQVSNLMREREQRQRERARSASQDEIRTAEQYPNCPECGAQLRDVPDVGEFPCTRCGTLLERTPVPGGHAPDGGGQDHDPGAQGGGMGGNKYRGPDEQV